MASSGQVVAAAAVLLLMQLQTVTSATFGARDPPPPALREAQAACVKYLGICENRLHQYNNSVYPTDQDTMCMVRCAGIMVGFWDDCQGLKLDGLANLFPALAANDRVRYQIMSCAEKRIATCPPQDTCARAYNGFRCFLDAQKGGFGAKDMQPQQSTPPQPFDAQEFIRSLSICAKLQRIPKDRRDLLFGAGQSESEFRRRANLCIDANQPLLEAQDKNAQAYVKLYRCFADQISALVRANANAMA
uniref:Odorant-binding protein AgamOBP39 n=1 Tax=Anopheles gambiae TaxID=7165 RepID=Q8I8P8_ANOGA|nr:odorant-binding protein AgamOBP39 [Anopheles gambiae]